MKALVFAPLHNTPGKRDVTGAFMPEARAFCLQHGLLADQVKQFNNFVPMPARAVQVRQWIQREMVDSVDTVAFFAHGWKDGIQAGFRVADPAGVASAARLAQSLADVCTRTPTVILYCCDTARDDDTDREDDTRPGPGGNGGFADKLRDQLGHFGIAATIYAHTTAGHTTWNPWVRRFDPDEVAGGHWVVEPHSELWLRWRRALHGTLRFRFPFMSTAEIEHELRKSDGVA